MKSKFTSFLTVILLSSVVFYAKTNDTNATTLLHRNAEELTKLADKIFIGICTLVEERKINVSNENHTTCTEYTFKILKKIKGTYGPTVKLRQIGKANGIGSIIGMPYYEKGRKYILFLRNESRYGLASPIGMEQGAFQMINSEEAVNNFGNKGLFHRMDLQSQRYKIFDENEKELMVRKKGAVNVNLFIGIIEKMLSLNDK